MKPTLLLYGATGYSGRLILRELMEGATDGEPMCEVVLAGRDEGELGRLSDQWGAPYRVFALDDRREVQAGLRDADIVLNAAGPFAWTAERIAKVAIDVGCHYADIGGEADVYLRLKELEPYAYARDCILAPSIGFWAAASNLLLASALRQLKTVSEVGAVRIAMSRVDGFSLGSAESVWRSLREQVVVARRTEDVAGQPHMGVWHEPVGKLERRFDFRDPGQAGPDIRVGSAVSLVDTLAALQTFRSRRVLAERVESYVEMDDAARMIYQMGSWFAPLAAMPWVGRLVQEPLQMLSRGPTPAERSRTPHLIVLEIEDIVGDILLGCRWKTPNIYDFTAQLAAAIAVALGASQASRPGWATACDLIAGPNLASTAPILDGPLRASQVEAVMPVATV